jgi:DNA primase
MSGRVLGFGGRILTNDKKAAKYLNSPEAGVS